MPDTPDTRAVESEPQGRSPLPHYTPLFASIRHSAKLADLPDDTCRMFYLLLLAQCDAWGRIDARPPLLLAEVWPLLGKDAKETERCRDALIVAGLVELHEGDRRSWLQIPDWEDKAGAVGRKRERRGSMFPHPTPETHRLPPAPTDNTPDLTGSHRLPPATHRPPPAPTSRARKPQPQPQPQPEPQPQPQKVPTEPHAPARVVVADEPAKEIHKGGNSLTRLWDRCWDELRFGTTFAWIKLDAVRMSDALKLAKGDVQELERRIRALLGSNSQWKAENATPRVLVSQWNSLTVEVKPLSKSDKAMMALQASVEFARDAYANDPKPAPRI